MKKYIRTLVVTSILISILLPSLASNTNIRAATSSFTFTAVGDYGANDNTSAVLDAIAASGASFNLALGDLSYGDLQPESSWCDYVKSHVGPNYPFELIAGNHDSGQIAAEGNITNFAACLPDRIGNIVGTYGKEYYFDYPATAPLARFILISPRIDFNPEGYYSYTAGSSHYNWVRDTIDNARASNIPWVVVATHKNCLGAGGHTCDIESGLFNLLISKKVDLILHGHNHNYQRSKQLAHSASCTAIVAGSYNSNCVVDDGADNLYTKDSGSVIVISGMGGRSLYDINTSDPEAPYFAKFMGGNINPTNGTVRFAVSDTTLTAEFVRANGGTFSDNFSIDKAGESPTATPVPTNTLVSDTFTRSVTDGWGSADTGGGYTLSGVAADFDVNGSAGTVRIPQADRARMAFLGGVSAQDVDISFRVQTDKVASGSNEVAYLVARRVSNNTEYWGQVQFGTDQSVYLRAIRNNNGSLAALGTNVKVSGLTHVANSYIRIRAQVVGTNPTTIRMKAWADGQAEPANWQYSVTDSTTSLQTAGSVGLRTYLAGSANNAPVVFTFDDFLVTAP